MRKTRTQKGITLIALIITIVVLLILAAVAISSITNDNILGYAQNAAKDYNQAVKNEQDMLQEYVNYLNGHTGSSNGNGGSSSSTTSTWTQSGTTVTNGTTTLAVGDSVTVKVGEGAAEAYSANGNSSWKVLGADEGKLLLVTTANVSSVALGGKEGGDIYGDGTEYVAGYNNGVEYLNGVCDDYLNTIYADEARSIRVEDINRITGFEPSSYSGYGTTYTYTAENNDGFMHADGRVVGTDEGEVESLTETSTYYDYTTSSSAIGEAAYNLLFGDVYWLASSYVRAGSDYANFGLRFVTSSYVSRYNLWDSYGNPNNYENGARAVVSLKSDVIVTKV